MRTVLTFVFLLFFAHTVFAQADTGKTATQKPPVIRICTPSRSSLMAPPLMVVFSHDRIIYQSVHGDVNKLDPESIKSINVLKDSSAVAKYGGAAKNGVLEIHLDDQKYPDAYKVFKTDSAASKKP